MKKVVVAACNCVEEGSYGISCGEDDGKCNCKNNVVGDKCEQCIDGTYKYPECEGKKDSSKYSSNDSSKDPWKGSSKDP